MVVHFAVPAWALWTGGIAIVGGGGLWWAWQQLLKGGL